MAQGGHLAQEAASTTDHASNNLQSLWRRLFGRDNGSSGLPDVTSKSGSHQDEDPRPGLIRRVSRKVVPGLPRAQTFKRQQSELRNNLEPVQTTPAERRAVSVDRKMHASQNGSLSLTMSNPRTSAPDFINHSFSAAPSVPSVPSVASLPIGPLEEKILDTVDRLDSLPYEPVEDLPHVPDAVSFLDAQSMTTSQYDTMIHDELERVWILNLSMHFRDKSKREKFFITYRERPMLWRRVTVSLDYRNAPENSLEAELAQTKFQREKSAKIYEAIRESLADIQFYDTVTNLKLQTTEGRLHVHVVEDSNEIIQYPSVRTIQHMRCNRVKERDIEFDSHMSGFVYKVRVNDEVLIKKEIPGPDTVDEFLYEINALNRLKYSKSVIKFYGVVVDDRQEYVKGILISFAEQGALIDVIYDGDHSLPWPTREKWARQIVQGLSEIHEAGFVQGDFTLSNIVVDGKGDAKIIDINRRGCPVGWEPPEATPLIENNQRISMYIGVKSDLYQLGMVLWALATQEDEPEAHGRPLRIPPDPQIPIWYRRVVDICLSEDPRMRLQALKLLSMMPAPEIHDPTKLDPQFSHHSLPSISVDDDISRHEYLVDGYHSPAYPWAAPINPPNDWSYVNWGHSYVNPAPGISDDPYIYPTRGRSPPSPLPSNHDGCHEPRYGPRRPPSYENSQVAPSVDDTAPVGTVQSRRSATPRTSRESLPAEGSSASTRSAGWGDPTGGTEFRKTDEDEEESSERPWKDGLLNGLAISNPESPANQSSDHMDTPMQEPGKPNDDVTEVHLTDHSEASKQDDAEVPALDSLEPREAETVQQQQSGQRNTALPACHRDPDSSSRSSIKETHSEALEALGIGGPGIPISAEAPGVGCDINRTPKEAINLRHDNPIDMGTKGNDDGLAAPLTGSPAYTSNANAFRIPEPSLTHDVISDNLKGLGSVYDCASDIRQDAITDDDFRPLQSTLETTMTTTDDAKTG